MDTRILVSTLNHNEGVSVLASGTLSHREKFTVVSTPSIRAHGQTFHSCRTNRVAFAVENANVELRRRPQQRKLSRHRRCTVTSHHVCLYRVYVMLRTNYFASSYDSFEMNVELVRCNRSQKWHRERWIFLPLLKIYYGDEGTARRDWHILSCFVDRSDCT